MSTASIQVLREKTGAGVMSCKNALTEANGDVEKAVEILRKKGLADVAKRSGRITKEGVVHVKPSGDGSALAVVELTCETDFVAKTPDFGSLAGAIADYVLAHPADKDYAEDAAVKEMILKVAPKVGENMTLRRASYFKAAAGAVGFYVHSDNKKAAVVELACDAKAKDKAVALARELALQIVAMLPRWVKREEVPADVIEKEKDIYRVQAKNQGKPDAAIEKMLEGRMRKFYEENCLVEQPSIRDSKLTVADFVKKSAAEAGPVAVVRFIRYQLGA